MELFPAAAEGIDTLSPKTDRLFVGGEASSLADSSNSGDHSSSARADARARMARYFQAESVRRERQIAALYELWRSLPDMETNRLLQRITERAVAALDAHTCSLMLRDPGGDTLRMVASVGLPQDVAESVTLLIGERIAGRVAASGQPILVPRDPRTHPLLASLPDAPSSTAAAARTRAAERRPDVESALCTPLLASDGEVLGVACLSRFVPADPFTEEDLRVFSLFAAQAAAATEAARLRADCAQAASNGALMAGEAARHQRLVEQGRMAAAVAHELRNPLSSIKGAAQFLLREFGLTDPRGNDDNGRTTTIRDFLTIIVDEVDGLGKLASEMMDFARPSPPSLSRERLSTVIAAEIAALRDDLSTLGVATVEECYEEGTRALVVEIDRVKTGYALRNLLRNAAQAAGQQHGMREASRPEVSVRIAQQENQVQITIIDNGAGVPEAVQDRLFEPFYTTRAKGLGLGLAQARQAIESQGGRILLAPSAAAGARFVICLPLIPTKVSDNDSRF